VRGERRRREGGRGGRASFVLRLEGRDGNGRALLVVVQVAELAFPLSLPPSSGRGKDAQAISSFRDGIQG